MKSKITAEIVTAVICLALSGAVAQGDESSLPFTDSESGGSAEASALVAIEKLVVENRRLKTEKEDAAKAVAALTAEAEVFKRQVRELTLRMEALGASTASPSALEQRVLQAANALRQSETNRDELGKGLVRLAQIAGEFAKTPDAEARLVLDAELRRVDEILAKAVAGDMIAEAAKPESPPADLLNGKVSAVKADIGCIVINVGSKQGVRTGMPFEVRRGDKVVATIRVVDARQTFAGTVIQNLVSDKDAIQVGDTVRVNARLN